MDDPLAAIELLTALPLIFALILASGFFSLYRHALNLSQKPRLHKEAQDSAESRKSKKYRRVLEAAENPALYHAAAHFWICVLQFAAAFLTGLHFAQFIMPGPDAPQGGSVSIALSAACVAAFVLAALFLGELIPRSIARAAPEKIAADAFLLFNLFVIPLRPFRLLVRRFSTLLRPIFPETQHGITEDELHIALVEGEKSGIVESKERTMVEGVFYLGDRPVGAFMTHRSEIQWLDVNDTPENIRAKAMEYREQRCFPVADGTLDAIIGAVYLEDIILDQHAEPPKGLRAIMQKAHFVPETMPALKAFESFKRRDANFLFVMDEYGGFAGVLSIRSLFAEIVGDLTAPECTMTQQEDGSWLADGGVSIDDAAELLSLPDLAAENGDYHTLAGFVLSLAGELPHDGDSFAYQGFRFKVVDMDGNRIDKVMISMEEKA
ncbi:MAG: hemolysin family protein [Treponema sp.]|jgi:putative hemolysin|nr:hemolysin family protein [Treponema sp.]